MIDRARRSLGRETSSDGSASRCGCAALRSLGAPVLAAILAAVSVGGCATSPSDPDARADFEALNDPLEPTNREIDHFNQVIYRAALRPVAIVYRDDLPEAGREAIHNFITNLNAPVVLANDSLQGEVDLAGETLCRFLVNSTLGLGGLIDVAANYMHLPAHNADFGQTLGVWGVPEGPYLVLPILQSSTARDAVGTALTFAVDPVSFAFRMIHQGNLVYVKSLAAGIDTLSQQLNALDDIQRTSLDPYATLRSAYRQTRDYTIKHPGGGSAGGP